MPWKQDVLETALHVATELLIRIRALLRSVLGGNGIRPQSENGSGRRSVHRPAPKFWQDAGTLEPK
jgi:hypothetical protein